MDWFLERARALGVEHQPPAPLLMGRHLLDLGVAPGPRMGEILQAVYEQQLDGQSRRSRTRSPQATAAPVAARLRLANARRSELTEG